MFKTFSPSLPSLDPDVSAFDRENESQKEKKECVMKFVWFCFGLSCQGERQNKIGCYFSICLLSVSTRIGINTLIRTVASLDCIFKYREVVFRNLSSKRQGHSHTLEFLIKLFQNCAPKQSSINLATQKSVRQHTHVVNYTEHAYYSLLLLVIKCNVI